MHEIYFFAFYASNLFEKPALLPALFIGGASSVDLPSREGEG